MEKSCKMKREEIQDIEAKQEALELRLTEIRHRISSLYGDDFMLSMIESKTKTEDSGAGFDYPRGPGRYRTIERHEFAHAGIHPNGPSEIDNAIKERNHIIDEIHKTYKLLIDGAYLVGLGSIVKVRYLDDGKILDVIISIKSALSDALMGKKCGDVIQIDNSKIEIVKITAKTGMWSEKEPSIIPAPSIQE